MIGADRRTSHKMSGKRDSARNALRRAVPFLAERHHDDILNALDAENLLDVEGKTPNGGRVHAVAGDVPKGRPILTLVQAAAVKKENASLVQQICATAQRMGLTCIEPDKQIDINTLNLELTNRNVGTTDRISLKAMLHRLHTIA
jgi:hypothetical protein